MNLAPNLVAAVAVGYALLLFAIAFQCDRLARRGRLGWMNSPLIYTLSISVYCTSWTFYGAVGTAARSGLEFATIYLGPTLVFVGWAALMAKLVRVGRRQRATSIADFLSARYGKSSMVAALVTLIAFFATTPYIALQLKAVAVSFHLIVDAAAGEPAIPRVTEAVYRTAFWIAVGMTVFGIIFGTRAIDVDDRRPGLVSAIAFEALVKLAALLAVGLFAMFWVADGPADVFARAPEHLLTTPDGFGARWAALTFLAGVAIICLPRQFQVTVVECVDERQGRTASWMFPLYLFLISLFVAPIAIVGLSTAPPGADADFFILNLPIVADQYWLTTLVFLGGFSSATSMMIVASIALSTMASNHVALPLLLRMPDTLAVSGDVRAQVLLVRRISIGAVLLLGFLYFRLSGDAELASIGLIAFAGVAQFLPSLLAALYWRRATTLGAKAGLSIGFLTWLATLFLPSVLGAEQWPSPVDPGGWLHVDGRDPLVSALFWSLGLNTVALVAGSLLRDPTPLERVQGAVFDDALAEPEQDADRVFRRSAASADLFVLAQRILGAESAHAFFSEARMRQGLPSGLPVADEAFISQLELRLARGIGSASARAMVSRVASGETISVDDVMRMADETARLVDYSHRLETKSVELERTAEQLRRANERLQLLDAQKDAFLSQVSHELRTPMASIRSFSEILLETPDLERDEAKRFLKIVHDETLRLTRLLDQILDLRGLERGVEALKTARIDPEAELDDALEATLAPVEPTRVTLRQRRAAGPVTLTADRDRLRQVFLNVLSNALKYGPERGAELEVETAVVDGVYRVRVSDNGPGVPAEDRDQIFARFARGSNVSGVQGLGVGLAICRDIVELHGGRISVDERADGRAGAVFEIALPMAGPPSPRKPVAQAAGSIDGAQ